MVFSAMLAEEYILIDIFASVGVPKKVTRHCSCCVLALQPDNSPTNEQKKSQSTAVGEAYSKYQLLQKP